MALERWGGVQEIIGKNGIICFMKIPDFDGQGHIDLWSNDRIVGADYWDAETIWFWSLQG